MSYTFKRAIRENVSLIVGLAGGTGSGKTFTAMRLATGLSHGKPFAVIDTENGRASHYADQFTFDACDLRAPFRPDAYAEAIMAADTAAYPVIVVDSVSHEWAGDGGILDFQEEELDRIGGTDDWKRREACKMASWIKPKGAHKKMMSKLLQVRAHLILAFRAEEKIEMVRDKDSGKMEVRAKQTLTGKDGWVPICEKNVPFEATCSFLLLARAPGIPNPIKLPEQMKSFITLDQPLDEKVGEKLAQWAAGGTVREQPKVNVVSKEIAPPLEPSIYHGYEHAIRTLPTRAAAQEQYKKACMDASLTQDEKTVLGDVFNERFVKK